MSLPPSSIIDLSDFPELPPPPGVYTSDAETVAEENPAPVAEVEPIVEPKKKKKKKELSIEEAMNELDPPPVRKPRMTAKRKLEMGLLDVGEKEIKQEEYNHHKIRLAAQKRVLSALNALDRVLLEDGDLYAIATPAQVLKAAEIVLDRAGDKPATAAPSPKENDTQDYILMDRSQLPTIH